MILISIYGRTEPIIISKKLGIGICNPQNDWVEGFPNDFDEEYPYSERHFCFEHIIIISKNEPCVKVCASISMMYVETD